MELPGLSVIEDHKYVTFLLLLLSLRSPATTISLGTNLVVYSGHASDVNSVVWSPDGKRIASASHDWTVQVWDAMTGNNLFTYNGHTTPVNTVAWSPDGKYIASGSGEDDSSSFKPYNTIVQVWDAATGSDILTYRGHSDIVNAVAWSPDSKRIASSSSDKTVQVWDAITGSKLFTYNGHTTPVNTVAWSPDGKYIASGSGEDDYLSSYKPYNTIVQVWDAATGSDILTYRGHSGIVNAVAWSPDSKRIASGSGNYVYSEPISFQVWDATSGSRNLYYW